MPVQPPVPAVSVAPSSATPVTTARRGRLRRVGGDAAAAAGAEVAWALPAELVASTETTHLVADVVGGERVGAAGLAGDRWQFVPSASQRSHW